MTSIQERRKSLNMTQNCLAGILSVSQPYLSYVENGKKRLSLPLLARLSIVLRANPVDVMQVAGGLSSSVVSELRRLQRFDVANASNGKK